MTMNGFPAHSCIRSRVLPHLSFAYNLCDLLSLMHSHFESALLCLQRCMSQCPKQPVMGFKIGHGSRLEGKCLLSAWYLHGEAFLFFKSASQQGAQVSPGMGGGKGEEGTGHVPKFGIPPKQVRLLLLALHCHSEQRQLPCKPVVIHFISAWRRWFLNAFANETPPYAMDTQCALLQGCGCLHSVVCSYAEEKLSFSFQQNFLYLTAGDHPVSEM